MSGLFAATYPGRTWALVLAGSYARTLWAPDYPPGIREDDFRSGMERAQQARQRPDEYAANVDGPARAIRCACAISEWRLFAVESATP